MVTVRLEGVHVVRSKGRAYHYAWRGGPRLPGAPGSPEYVAAFHEAHKARKRPKTGTLKEAIVTYRASAAYENLSDSTRRAYGAHLDLIEAKFGTTPWAVLGDRRFKADAIDWRDTMRDTPRQADYALGTFRRLLEHAKEDRGLLTENVLDGIKTLHRSNRSDSIWSADEVERFNAVASPELRWALALGVHTGLRQGDLIRLPWGAFNGSRFTLRTSKTDKRVIIPAHATCQALMAAIPKRQLVILTTARGGRQWTGDGLRSSFGKACIAAGVKRTFHDLRRTAATHHIINGLPSSQVALIMGWSEAEVESLKRIYVDAATVIEGVLAKLEKGG